MRSGSRGLVVMYNRDWWALGAVWLVAAVSRVVNLHETDPSPRWSTFLIWAAVGSLVALTLNDLIGRRSPWGGLVKRVRPNVPVGRRLIDAARLTALIAIAALPVQLTDSTTLAWLWVVLAAVALAYALVQRIRGDFPR